MIKFLTLLGYDPAKHSVKVEMLAGLTTFLTMSYILAVNPLILCETGMDKGAVFSATVIAAAIATLVMAFYAKMPFALASGMGINAFFAYTLVLVMGYTWQQALAAVLVEGVVFIVLTLFRVREAIVKAIPINLRYSISVGIGLFIAYIGLKNGGIIMASESTMTALAPWSATTLIAVGGIILGSILLALKVRGALFYTILIMTIVGIPFGVTQLPENFSLISMPHSLEPIAFHIDFSRFTGLDVNYIIALHGPLRHHRHPDRRRYGRGDGRQADRAYPQPEQSPDGRRCRNDRGCHLWYFHRDDLRGEYNRYP